MKQTAPTSRSLRNLLQVPVLGAALLLLGGANECDPNRREPEQPAEPRVLKISTVQTSQARARPGDVIEVGWTLDNADLRDTTSVRMYSPLLTGFDQQSVDTRDTVDGFRFIFQSPVTIEIEVADASGQTSAVAFDIGYDDDAYLEVGALNTIENYPRLGSGSADLRFQSFAAFHDADGDGYIDFLANRDDTRFALPQGYDFLNVSQHSRESSGYGMTWGGSFPLLTPNFLSTSYGRRFAGRKADLIVFGGSVAYSGDVFEVKAPGGVVRGVTGAKLGFEAIHAELVYVSDDAGVLHLADAFLGNRAQGLITTIFRHGDILLATGCADPGGGLGSQEACGAYTIAPTTQAPSGRQYNMPAQGVGEITGDLRATLGWTVENAAGLFHPQVHVGKLRFRMPMYSDADAAAGGRLHPDLEAIQFGWF